MRSKRRPRGIVKDQTSRRDAGTRPRHPESATPENAVFLGAPKLKRRRIFISYGHDQYVALAEQLKRDLQTSGHEVWFDADRLKPGGDWEDYIEEGLKWVAQDPEQSRVLLLMTPHSIRRPDGYCSNEIARAVSRRMSVVPVMVVWVEPLLSICRIQWLDMRDCVPLAAGHERYKNKFRLLVDAIEKGPPEFEGMQACLCACLEPLHFEAEIEQHVPRFTGRAWVLKKIDDWLANPNASRLFWIVGPPGTGKTALAAFLCSQRREVAAFHLCCRGHEQKADPSHCVRSIAFQLSTQLPDYAARFHAMGLQSLTKNGDAHTLFNNLIVTPLSGNFPRPDRTIVIVLDALDEATVGSTNELAGFIALEFKKTPSWLRLVITSRPEPEVMFPLQGYHPFELDIAGAENREDIREYLRRELKSFTEDPNVLSEAIETILTRSEGVFLYVDCVRTELAEGHLSLDRLHEFPQGLGGIYAELFARLFPEGDGLLAYESRVRPVLAVVAAAYESLSEELLTAIFGWRGLDQRDPLDSLVSWFPRRNQRIRPFHLSILEWLADKDRAAKYFVSVQEGHRKLADYCWGECMPYLTEDRPLRDPFTSSYAFRHGVRHLVESGRYAQAVDLLDYLVRNEQKLEPGQRLDLDQFAKLITSAMGRSPPIESEAKQIAPHKLARLLQGLYMTDPLYGGIRLILEHHPRAWPEILDGFLATDDYVLRHTISEALAENYLDFGRPSRLEEILKLTEDADINRRELGSYALGRVYANDPTCIEPKYLNLLAEGETYPFRSALGDLLLNLVLQEKDRKSLKGIAKMKLVVPSSRFWNPIWDFNRMDVCWLNAADYFVRDQPLPAEALDGMRKAHDSLVRTEKLRQDLLRRKENKLPESVSKPLESYYRLGLKEKEKEICDAQSAMNGSPALRAWCEVLFAHPLWEVTESAASVLASIVDDNQDAGHIISDLFEHDLWRVQFGAAEAAFLARFKNRNDLFRKAVERFYQHPEPLLRGNCAENLTAWILDSHPSEYGELLAEFAPPLRYWLQNPQEDCWVLDHIYRLFHRLQAEGHEQACQPLLSTGVSRLLQGEPTWYCLDRKSFLRRIEERKRPMEPPGP